MWHVPWFVTRHDSQTVATARILLAYVYQHAETSTAVGGGGISFTWADYLAPPYDSFFVCGMYLKRGPTWNKMVIIMFLRCYGQWEQKSCYLMPFPSCMTWRSRWCLLHLDSWHLDTFRQQEIYKYIKRNFGNNTTKFLQNVLSQ